MTINARALATLGIGYGAIAAATLGLVVDGEPAQPQTRHFRPAVVQPFVQSQPVQAVARSSEFEDVRAEATIVILSDGYSRSGETAKAGGKVSTDARRVAMLDDELLWL